MAKWIGSLILLFFNLLLLVIIFGILTSHPKYSINRILVCMLSLFHHSVFSCVRAQFVSERQTDGLVLGYGLGRDK